MAEAHKKYPKIACPNQGCHRLLFPSLKGARKPNNVARRGFRFYTCRSQAHKVFFKYCIDV